MKILIIYLLTLFSGSDYCEGFNQGWDEGWCYQRVGCVAPPPPACPVRTAYEDDTYTDGYNRGFQTARDKRQ